MDGDGVTNKVKQFRNFTKELFMLDEVKKKKGFLAMYCNL